MFHALKILLGQCIHHSQEHSGSNLCKFLGEERDTNSKFHIINSNISEVSGVAEVDGGIYCQEPPFVTENLSFPDVLYAPTSSESSDTCPPSSHLSLQTEVKK